MISYLDALQIIRGLHLEPRSERVPLENCCGRRLAADIHAKIPSPPFTNSAMDGYALRLADIPPSAAFPALSWTVAGTIFARPVEPADIPSARSDVPTCVRIMTGGYLPEWADTVIPVEDATTGADGRVRFTARPELGANVRRRGDDMTEGSLLLKAGTLLEPERIMIAAAFGHRDLIVAERPALALFATGDELVEPDETLRPGGLYNSSKYFLLAAAQRVGLAATSYPTVPDDERVAATRFGALLDSGAATVLVTTGAVSMGELDFIPKVAKELGFKALFHKVAIRPGKPVFLAQRDNVLWLGLPGNAISTCVGWHVFARPLLATVADIPEPPRRTLVLANEVRKPEGLRCFFRAEVNSGKVWVAKRQGSAELAASISNAAYVELPEEATRVPADSKVEAIFV